VSARQFHDASSSEARNGARRLQRHPGRERDVTDPLQLMPRKPPASAPMPAGAFPVAATWRRADQGQRQHAGLRVRARTGLMRAAEMNSPIGQSAMSCTCRSR